MPFEDLDQLVLEHAPDARDARWVLAGARARAQSMLRGDDSPGTVQVGLAVYLAEALTGLWLERDWTRETIQALIGRVATATGVSGNSLALDVGSRVLRDPGLLQLPPYIALEAQMRRLLSFAPYEQATLWAIDAQQGATRVMRAGDEHGIEQAAELASHILSAGSLPSSRSSLSDDRFVTVSILRWQQPHAVLVCRRAAGDRSRAGLIEEAAASLGAVMERDALLHRNAEMERRLVESSERRIERLALDLHDGPVQDVVALANEVRHFRRQLGEALDGHRHSGLIVGRVDDVEARLVSLHDDLRGLSESLASPTALKRPLAQLVEQEAAAMESRSGIDVTVEATGDLDALPPGHRITLLRIVQEALSNAREHSGADQVRVELRVHPACVEAVILDNGRGFDVNATLVAAAERGRLGLVGISERAHLVSGTCDVRSRPGGPTEICVALPRFADAVAPAASRSSRA